MNKSDIAPVLFWLGVGVALLLWAFYKYKLKREDDEMLARLSPDERYRILEEREEQRLQKAAALNARVEASRASQKAVMATQEFGPINAAMVCPHCQTKGGVRTKKITQKKGISGGKATAAVLTGGVSLLAVGLSRKEASTQAHCDACGNTWLF